jgi:hypothetical protein
MKITGIDKSRSEKGKLVLLTDPPLTPSVFSKFLEVWQVANFEIEGHSLVWFGPAHIDKEFAREAEIYLTEAENAIKADKTRDENSNEQYLQKVSDRTGLPLI